MVRIQRLSILVTIATKMAEKSLFSIKNRCICPMCFLNTLEIRVFQISISFLVETWAMVRTQHLSILVTIPTEMTEKSLFSY